MLASLAIRPSPGRRPACRRAGTPRPVLIARAGRAGGAGVPSRMPDPGRSCAQGQCRCGRRCRRSGTRGEAPGSSGRASCTARRHRRRRRSLRARCRWRSRCSRSRPFQADAPACQARSKQPTNWTSSPSRRIRKCAETLSAGDGRVIRVRPRVEPVGEESRDAVAAEFPGRQRDAVHDDERDRGSRRARVAVRAIGSAAPGSRNRARRLRAACAWRSIRSLRRMRGRMRLPAGLRLCAGSRKQRSRPDFRYLMPSRSMR